MSDAAVAATRLLHLLELLQSRPGRTGAELAERLGVDVRTVRRGVARLGELGVVVTADRGRHGGYRVGRGATMPPVALTDDEAVAAVLGLLVAERMGLVATAPATGQALLKLRRLLPAASADRVDAVAGTAQFTTPAREPTAAPAAGTLLALAEATAGHRGVALRYTSHAGAETDRDLDPYGLVSHSGRWYVTGHDHRRGEVRTFRLDRIYEVTPTGRAFTPPADFDAVATVIAGLASVPWTHEVEVLLHCTLEQAVADIPRTLGSLTATEGGVLLRTRAEHLDGAARQLASMKWGFTVLRPDALRDELAALAARLTSAARP